MFPIKRQLWLCFISALALIMPTVCHSHPLIPSLWQLKEHAEHRIDFEWVSPNSLPAGVSPPLPRLPAECGEPEQHRLVLEGAMRKESWSQQCPKGLNGLELTVEGLAYEGQRVLIKLLFADGSQQHAILNADRASFVVGAGEQALQADWIGYGVIGVEHILLGWDHLAFIALLVLSGWPVRQAVPWRWVLKASTAFTVGHSMTLLLTVLGLVAPAQFLIEAGIAASIVWVAGTSWAVQKGQPHLQHGVLFALMFGLLHGFGFAGALQEVGLPDQDRLLALLMFNLGIEVGQLLFVLLLLIPVLVVVQRFSLQPVRVRLALCGGLGGLAAYWFWSRLLVA